VSITRRALVAGAAAMFAQVHAQACGYARTTEDAVLKLRHYPLFGDPQMTSVSTSHDFDFLIGNWAVHHRKLKHRLAHSDDWETFSGTCEMKTLLSGSANVDDNVLAAPDGTYRAASLRAFDPSTKMWSIWWLDGRHPHRLDAPVAGGFSNGVGAFFGADTWNGQAIRVRFVWSDITPNSARWQQAFSLDNGKTWETNWIMDFRRVAP
jgi:hypothetical protein